MNTKALSLIDNFNQLTPYAVGFDRMFDQLNRYVDNSVTSTGFPPYNIQKGGDNTYQIEMALAGFSKDDIEVEIADGTLSVRSDKKEDEKDEFTYHRGISFRKFNRKFTLSDDIVIPVPPVYVVSVSTTSQLITVPFIVIPVPAE